MSEFLRKTFRNPKKVQREVRKQVESAGIGTKSQLALKLQQEQMKTERKTMNREQREAEKERRFAPRLIQIRIQRSDFSNA